jgi:hypothetical protein
VLEVIDDNEAAIEQSGVILHSYTAPGAGHQIFEPDKFYELGIESMTPGGTAASPRASAAFQFVVEPVPSMRIGVADPGATP